MARSTRSSSWPRRTIRPVAEITLKAPCRRAQSGIFFDAINRHFRGAAEHREHGAVFQEVDGVVAPLAGGDHASIEIEDAFKLAPTEGDLVRGGGTALRAGDPPPRGWLGSVSPETNVMRRLPWVNPMIAPVAPGGKSLWPQRMAMKRPKTPVRDHELVKSIIITPNFGQSPVMLGGDKPSVASKARSGSSTGFLSPPAPRGLADRAS